MSYDTFVFNFGFYLLWRCIYYQWCLYFYQKDFMVMYNCIFTYECVFYYVLGQRWPNKQVKSVLSCVCLHCFLSTGNRQVIWNWKESCCLCTEVITHWHNCNQRLPISLLVMILDQLSTLYQTSGCSKSIVTHINALNNWELCYNYCDIKSSMFLVIIISPVHCTKFLVTAYPLWHVQVPESIMILTDRKICFNCYDIKSCMCLAILSKWKKLPTKYS